MEKLERWGQKIYLHSKITEELFRIFEEEIEAEDGGIPSLIEGLLDELSKRKDSRVLSFIVRALEHENKDVRWAAVDAVREYKEINAEAEDEFVLERLEKMLQDKSAFVRAAALRALKEWGSPKIESHCLKAMGTESFHLNLTAANLMRELPSIKTKTLDALLDMASKGNSFAVFVLGKHGKNSKEAKAILLQMFPTVEAKEVFMQALAELGVVEAIPMILQYCPNKYPPAFRSWSNIHEASVNALVKLARVEGSLDYLAEALQSNETSMVVIIESMLAFGESKNVKAIPFILYNLKNKNPRIRSFAAKSLGQIGDAKVVPQLVKALNDKVDDVRHYATDALVAIGVPAVPYLTQAFNNEDTGVRCIIANVLGRIGDKRAADALEQALNDEDSWVRRAAAKALGNLQ